MFRIYDLDAFIDRPIYMHDLYALYASSLSKCCSIWRELDSIIRELHHYFSSMFPASMISACCETNYGKKLAKVKGFGCT